MAFFDVLNGFFSELLQHCYNFLPFFGAVAPLVFDHKKIMSDVSYPYKQAVLKNRKGDLSKRWFVEFYVWDLAKSAMVRIAVYLPARYRTLKERKAEGQRICELVNKRLQKGEVIDSSKKAEKPETIKGEYSAMLLTDAILMAYKVKCSNSKKQVSKDNYATYYKLLHKWITENGHNKVVVQHVTPLFLKEYFDWLAARKNFGNRSYNNYVEFTKGFFNVLKEYKIIRENPVTIPLKTVTQASNYVFNTEEKSVLLNAIKERDIKLFYFCKFIYYSFLRPDELTNLQVKHIRGDKLYVPGTSSKMYGSDYIVIVHPLQEIISELGLMKLPSETYVFAAGKKEKKGFIVNMIYGEKKYNHKHFTKKHLPIAKFLGFNDRFTLYSWKDTGIVDLYNVTRDIHFTSKQARHHSIEYTQIYLRDRGAMLDFDKAGNTPKLPV